MTPSELEAIKTRLANYAVLPCEWIAREDYTKDIAALLSEVAALHHTIEAQNSIGSERIEKLKDENEKLKSSAAMVDEYERDMNIYNEKMDRLQSELALCKTAIAPFRKLKDELTLCKKRLGPAGYKILQEYTKLKDEVAAWQERANINGKRGIEWQEKYEVLQDQHEGDLITIKDLENQRDLYLRKNEK